MSLPPGDVVAAETERLLAGRTRDIHLEGQMLRLYRAKTWQQRAKIVRAWMVWVGVLNLLMVGIGAVLSPHLLGLSLTLSGVLLPMMHALVWWLWRRPRGHRVEAASLIVTVLLTMLAYGGLGLLSGGVASERYLTGALFVVAVALVVFDIGLGWTAAMGAAGLLGYTMLLVANPLVDWTAATAMTLFYGMGFTATVAARRTATIISQKGFLLMLRDGQRRAALAEANARLAQLATTDTLTGLANRRSANEQIDRLWGDPSIARSAIAFVMADIDHFKRLNDNRGHAAGDDCIRRVGEALKRSVQGDGHIVSRYGGEEFLIVLVDAPPAAAAATAERMRRAVEDMAIPCGVPGLTVTISLGIACAQDGVAVARVAKWADDALYEAKRLGRNRVCCSESCA